MIIPQPFLSIRAASAVVNLSEAALRRGCRNGTIPHIRHNGRLYIDIPALLDRLPQDGSTSPDGETVHGHKHLGGKQNAE